MKNSAPQPAIDTAYFERLSAHLRSRHPDELHWVSTLLEEALFGVDVIGGRLKEISEQGQAATVLEVGAGAFILSTWLAQLGYKVTALEPLGVGFGALRRIQDSVLEFAEAEGLSFTISRDFVEEHKPSAMYDFAFAINVFEHIERLDDAFGAVTGLLREGGALRVACPNYHFPYESHYSIPIIFNGRLTRKLFRTHIERFDKEHDCNGLWDSINFINSSRAARLARSHRLQVNFHKEVVVRMFDRFKDGTKISQRHGAIALPARILLQTNLHLIVRHLPVAIHPYMVFDLVVPDGHAAEAGA
ncbi:class I SAM-dependent methyltransferase [Maricaulaceae bacterium MS644]